MRTIPFRGLSPRVVWLAIWVFMIFITSPGSGFAASGLEIGSKTDITATGNGDLQFRVEVSIQNEDPATKFNPLGTSYFYNTFTAQVLHGYRNLRVTGPGGGNLSYSVKRTYHDLPISVIEITSPKQLFFGDSLKYTISYDLGTTRTEDVFVTPNYMYFPIFTSANGNSVINIYAPPGNKMIVNNAECAGEDSSGSDVPASTSGRVSCVVDTEDFLGWAEIMDPSKRTSMTDSTVVGDTTYPMEIEYFSGEETWANHVKLLVKQAIPLLHNEYSAPLPGEFKILVKETGLGETQGYGGRFRCDDKSAVCQISALPPQSDSVLVHETSHLWSYLYSSTWLAEGFAQFTTENVSRRLGIQYDGHEANTADYPRLPLDVWTNPEEVLTSTASEQEAINIYYAKSADLLRTLQRSVGDNALRLANKQLAEKQLPANSAIYMDTLEETSKTDLDGLFINWVFGTGARDTIKHRRDTIHKIASLEAEIRPMGLEVPRTVTIYRDQWDFEKADSEIDKALASLPVFKEAREKMETGSSVAIDLISLVITPETIYRTAAQQFKNGNFKRSETIVLQVIKIYEYAPLIALWLAGFLLLVLLVTLARRMLKR